MKISSLSFKDGENIPEKFTCQGADINPSLNIEALPQAVKSLVLIVDDPDAPGGVWVHWVVFNIKPTSIIEENSVPGILGINSFEKTGYGGPCPPSGVHRYFFKVYALDSELDLPEGCSVEDVRTAIKGHVLDMAQIIGLYKKK